MNIIAKEATLEMAHRLPNHNGKCRNIHGHSWKLKLAVHGDIIQISGHPSEGMVVDFTDLKPSLNRICDLFDHAVVLYYKDPLAKLLLPDVDLNALHIDDFVYLEGEYGRMVITQHIPTSEMLAMMWGRYIIQRGLLSAKFFSLTVNETCTSEAIWMP